MTLLRCLRIGALMALAVSSLPAEAQSQKSKEDHKNQDETIKLKANLTAVDEMVQDSKGRYITDLKPEDFSVFENDVRQTVGFFDPPLSDCKGRQSNATPAQSAKSSGMPT